MNHTIFECNLHVNLLFVGIDTFHSFDEFFTFKCFQHFIELGLNKIRFHSDITDPQAFVARLFNDFIDNFFLLVTFDGRSVGFQLVKQTLKKQKIDDFFQRKNQRKSLPFDSDLKRSIFPA